MNNTRLITLLILNYNGKSFLEGCLKSALAASEFAGGQIVRLVDNSSTDGSVDFVRKHFPAVEVAVHTNLFLFSYNEAVKNVKTPYVFLLNNDVELKEDCIPPLLEHFQDSRVFAVQSKMVSRDGEINAAKRYYFAVQKRGFLAAYPRNRLETPAPTACASGGASLFDRKKFIELGGFDPLFYPAYSEDRDLCYRAWKHGWWSLYDPRSVVIHENHGTIGKYFLSKEIRMLYERNRLLFIWKNIRTRGFLPKHALFLLLRLLKREYRGSFILVSLFPALKRLPGVLRARKKEGHLLLTDSQIWELVNCDEMEAFKLQYENLMSRLKNGCVPPIQPV